MFFVMQTMRICKMGISRTNAYRLRVHKLRKALHTSGNVLGDHNADIVCRFDQQNMQRLIQRHPVPCLNSKCLYPVFIDHCIFRSHQHIVQIAIFQCDKRSHHLRHTCRIQFAVDVVCIDHTGLVQIKQAR